MSELAAAAAAAEPQQRDSEPRCCSSSRSSSSNSRIGSLLDYMKKNEALDSLEAPACLSPAAPLADSSRAPAEAAAAAAAAQKQQQLNQSARHFKQQPDDLLISRGDTLFSSNHCSLGFVSDKGTREALRVRADGNQGALLGGPIRETLHAAVEWAPPLGRPRVCTSSALASPSFTVFAALLAAAAAAAGAAATGALHLGSCDPSLRDMRPRWRQPLRRLLAPPPLLLLLLLLLVQQQHEGSCKGRVFVSAREISRGASAFPPSFQAAALRPLAAGAAASRGRCDAPDSPTAAQQACLNAAAAAAGSPAAAAAAAAPKDASAGTVEARPLSFPLGFLVSKRKASQGSWLQQQQQRQGRGGLLAGLRESEAWRCCSRAYRKYWQIPQATRFWMSLSLLLSLLGSGDPPLLPPEALCMHWGRFTRALELWRPLTGALYQGPLSFSTLTRLYAAFVVLRQLEGTERQALLQQPCSNPTFLSPQRRQQLQQQQQQLLQQQRELQRPWRDPKAFAAAAAEASGTAHLLQFLGVQCMLLAAGASMLRMPFYGSPLTAAATYVLSRQTPDKRAPLPLGLEAPHWLLPFALAAVDALQQQSLTGAVPALLGIATGHVFFFLKKVIPARTGIQALPFPSRTYRLLMQQKARAAAGAAAAPPKKGSSISSRFLQ
ncbi:hypothetical protein Emag_002851 [Eimeria magna]